MWCGILHCWSPCHGWWWEGDLFSISHARTIHERTVFQPKTSCIDQKTLPLRSISDFESIWPCPSLRIPFWEVWILLKVVWLNSLKPMTFMGSLPYGNGKLSLQWLPLLEKELVDIPSFPEQPEAVREFLLLLHRDIVCWWNKLLIRLLRMVKGCSESQSLRGHLSVAANLRCMLFCRLFERCKGLQSLVE